jgi:site-specific recombinase XerD
MNINDLITHYVEFRRTLGERCRTNEFLLRAFCRTVGPRTKVSKIRLKDVNAFLACPKALTRTWHCKYFALKGFFKFAISRGHLDKAPLPTEVPKLPPTVVPYIYSRREIRRLLDAIPLCRPFASRMERPTMRAILLTVYGAGLRRSEVLNLSVEDVDLSNAMLTIRNTKFFKTRLVPISSDLTKVLNEYARWRARTHPSARSGTFFVNTRGEPVHRCTLHKAFTQLREHAGVQRSDGGRYQPRLHDLRHAFAVHRLTTWYQQGADVQRLIHHLSVYLGHAHLVDTQVYLTMTPELLDQAGSRFERWYNRKEDDHA